MTGYTTNEGAAFNGYVTKNQTAPPPNLGGTIGPGLGCSVQSEVESVLTPAYTLGGN